MMLSRLNALAATVVLLGASTVGVLAFAQWPKESTRPDQPRGQAVDGVPSPQPVRSLLEARIATARDILKQDLDRLRYQVGTPGSATEIFDKIPIWSRRLMEDRLRLATTHAERLDAIREHRNRMVVHERMVYGYTQAGQGRLSEALESKYHRLEADQLLAEAGIDPAKELPVAELKANPAPPPPAPPAPTPPVPR